MKFGDIVYVISGVVRAVEYRGEYTYDGRTFVMIWVTSGQGSFKIHDFPRESVYTTKEEADKTLFIKILQNED